MGSGSTCMGATAAASGGVVEGRGSTCIGATAAASGGVVDGRGSTSHYDTS